MIDYQKLTLLLEKRIDRLEKVLAELSQAVKSENPAAIFEAIQKADKLLFQKWS